MNVLILAASTRSDPRAEPPDCLAEVNGEPLLEHLAESIRQMDINHCLYAFAKAEIDYWNLDSVAEQITPNPVIISVENQTAGALCTALLAAPHINNEDELLILSANELVLANLEHIISGFRAKNADAGIMLFESVHPRYAFACVDDSSFVTQVAERRPISRLALPGVFWFARGQNFVSAAKQVILKDNALRGVFYISSALNELILSGLQVASNKLEKSQYIPLKTAKLQDRFETLHSVDTGAVRQS